MEYFLDNLYLDNERQIFSRHGILSRKALNPVCTLTEQDKDKVRRSVIIKQLEEAERRIIKIDVSMRRLIKNIDDKERSSLFMSAPFD
jgi:hypothetical protein